MKSLTCPECGGSLVTTQTRDIVLVSSDGTIMGYKNADVHAPADVWTRCGGCHWNKRGWAAIAKALGLEVAKP